MTVGVFLDRDGVLNALVARDGGRASPRRLADFQLLAGAADAVRRLQERGCLVFVVTNQPDVARGHVTAEEIEAMHRSLRAAVPLTDLMVCPHDDADDCACRKPKPGMLRALAATWGLDLALCFVVGDSWRDVEAGRRAGCRTILVEGGERRACAPDWAAATLADAAAIIASQLDATRAGEEHGLRP